DPSVMRITVARAKQHGVAIGAHPSFPDLIGFGRRNMDVSPDDIYDLMVYQIGALLGVARAAGVEIQHVKAHGALYNMAALKPARSVCMATVLTPRSSCRHSTPPSCERRSTSSRSAAPGQLRLSRRLGRR